MASLDPPTKHQAFLALLQEGRPSLHLDARREGVVVPAHLKADAHLVLQYGIDLPIPIMDLVVDESGVRATLSFSRTPHPTFVPWPAVYVIATDDGRGVLYPEDVPSDVAIIPARADGEPVAELGGAPGASASSPPADPVAARAASDPAPTDEQKVVGGLEGGGASDANPPAPAPPRRTLRSIPLDVAMAPPDAVADLDEAAELASSVAGSGGTEPLNTPRRRRKPQLRLVK